MNSFRQLLKNGLFTLGLMAGCITAFAQPTNDNCANAIALGCGQTLSGSTAGATNDGVGFCGTSNTAPGVWYTIVGTGSQITLSTCNQASYDTKISVFSGSCGSLSCVGGQDDATGCSGFTTEFDFNSTAGTTYYVLIHGFGSGSGSFNLTATCIAPVQNDVCATATPISCGQAISGSTTNANPDVVPFCGTSSTSAGVWYSVTGTGGPIIASLCAGTNYDSKLSVYTGSCGALTCVTGNDDFCGLQSEVDWISNSGQTYYVLVHGFGSSRGDFTLRVDCPQPPANDDACAAMPITWGVTGFTNQFATSEAGEVDPGAGTGQSSCNSQDGWCSFDLDVDNSVWFTFEAPASGCVTIAAVGGDLQAALWSVDDCGDFSTYGEIAANDDSGDDIVAGANSLSAGIIEAACLTPGQTYYLQVDGYNGATVTNGEIHLIDCGGSLPTVDAGDCQSSFIGYAPAEMDTNFLVATGTGGVAPYTFSWSPAGLFQVDNGANSTLAVQPGGTTSYTVTITDARGCTASDDVEVNLVDVSCGNNGNKALVCHVPPGNPGNAHAICISANAVGSHLDNHDDHLGPCDNACLASNPSVPAPLPCQDLTLELTTDNFGNETAWQLVDVTDGVTVDEALQGSLDDATTYELTYCLDPTHCYEFRIQDSFGDGICCTFGTGGYSIDFNGASYSSPNNGAFGSGEVIEIGQCNKSALTETPTTAASEIQMAAYPNPSNGTVNLKVRLPEDGQIDLGVYDLNGRLIETIYQGQAAGERPTYFIFNGNDLSDGVYIYRLITEHEVKSGKLYIAR